MRVGYIQGEDGKLVRKFVKEADVDLPENRDLLYRVSAQFGDYCWTDEAHIEDAKEVMLDILCSKIRRLAKLDEFWVIRDEADYRKELLDHPFYEDGKINGTPVEDWIPQEAKEGKLSVAWKVEISTLERYLPKDEAEQLTRRIEEIIGD